MQISAASGLSRLEIHFDLSIHDRNPHHRRLRIPLHASDAGTLGTLKNYFSPASSVVAAGADSSANVSLAASAPSASVAAANSVAACAASAAA